MNLKKSAYIYTYAYAYIHMHIYTHICIYICIYIHIYIYTYAYTYTYIYVHVHIHLHIYIYMHICICITDSLHCTPETNTIFQKTLYSKMKKRTEVKTHRCTTLAFLCSLKSWKIGQLVLSKIWLGLKSRTDWKSHFRLTFSFCIKRMPVKQPDMS